MAQSDKRTFTKALDDLLVVEKEQLLDESAVRINRLEDKCARLNLAIGCQNEQLSANSYTIDELRDENEHLNRVIELKDEQLDCLINTVKRFEVERCTLKEEAEAGFEVWARLKDLNDKNRQSLEKHKRISGILSLLLISSVAAQLAVIFLGG